MAYEPYANGWPDLKKLDELAKKVDSMDTFTSTDKQFIEDLIKNQAAALGFDNTDTDFQSDNVEDAIKEAANMGVGLNLSSTPTVIGKWNDQDLYAKICHIDALPNNTNADYDSGITDTITVRTMIGMTSGTSPVLIPRISYKIDISYKKSENKIQINTSYNYSSSSADIIVLYTIDPTP